MALNSPLINSAQKMVDSIEEFEAAMEDAYLFAQVIKGTEQLTYIAKPSLPV